MNWEKLTWHLENKRRELLKARVECKTASELDIISAAILALTAMSHALENAIDAKPYEDGPP